MTKAKAEGYSIFNNSRFYILVSTILVSLVIMSLLRLQIFADQLFYIRLQQVFGLLCVFYWYFALVISPIGYIIGKHRTKRLEFARRAIGVSAFYFALLHAVVALWGQFGGPSQLQFLPSLFRWSLFGGAIALTVLMLMALTSFDRVIKFMTFRKWKWLHRLVYAGGVLAVLHIWSIGTHMAYSSVQYMAFAALVLLSGLELYRVAQITKGKLLKLDKVETAALFVACWVIIITLIAAIPYLVDNYHSRHGNEEGGSHSGRHL